MTATPPEVHLDGRYNGRETAELLGISRTTLWRIRESRQLVPRYHKGSMRPRYHGKDILAYWRAEYQFKKINL